MEKSFISNKSAVYLYLRQFNRMKISLFLSIYFLTFFYGYCQQDIPEIRAQKITLQVPDIAPATVKSDITNIQVIDVRQDTSSFGFYKSADKNYAISLEQNSVNEISSYLNHYLQFSNSANGSQIIMAVKKLLLTNECIEEGSESVNKKNANGSWLKGVIAKFEFFYSYEDGYIPIYRFDTIYTGTKDIRTNASEYIVDILKMSVQKLMTTDFKNVRRKKMSIQDIYSYYNQQLNVPVIIAKIYKNGVYKTFEEFKMNNPSITEFEVKKEELTQTVFIKDDKSEYPVRDVWGYCDKNKLYIQSADNYFQLVKKQNTFICFGAKDLFRDRHIKVGNVLMGGVLAGGIGKGNKKVSYTLNRKVYEVDMETGELY